MAEQNLKDKTVKGTVWSGIDNVARFGVTFVVSIVLARLLSPDDYGLIGIVTIFTSVCTALVDGGFGDALVRKKDVTDDDYNTVFIVNLGISALLYVIIFVGAPYIARFFHREELILLTRISCLSLIMGALSLVQLKRLVKIIDFRTQTKITIIASIVSGIVGIVMALLGCGVWSLVAQNLMSQGLRTILLWYYNRWRPHWRFSVISFKGLFSFGWKIMISGILDAVWKELYQVVVGKYYSSSALGQYTRAKQFSSLISSNITNVVQRVTFPVLSSIQDERARMLQAYRSIIKTTMFLVAISTFFIGAISEPLLFCLIGPQWSDAANYLPFICLAASLYPLNAINCNLLMVQGRSDLLLALEIVKKIIAIGPLYVGAVIGIMPMLYVNILTSFIAFLLNSSYSGRLLGYNSFMQLKDVLPSFGVALAVAGPVFFLKYLPLSNWIILPLQFFAGVLALFLIYKLTRLQEFQDILGILRSIVMKVKK